MSSSALKLLAASGAKGEATYVDDVFSTFLYDGNGSTQNIVNSIDLSGEGGLVWSKWRSGYYTSRNHVLFDTERGRTAYLASDNSSAQVTSYTNAITYNSNGFTWNQQFPSNMNFGSEKFASWTFRKAPGFFDVVTYTGNGTAGRTVSHNLGSVPGMIIVKSLTNSFDWQVYHRSKGNTHGGTLNEAYAFADSATYWNDTSPTSAQFTVGDGNGVNYNNEPYVAYLFAHDAQDFGENSDESIIKCGSFSYTAGTPLAVDLGFEAQWVITKRTDATEHWYMADIMRGMYDGDGPYLAANLSNAEGAVGVAAATATGFIFDPGTNNMPTGDYIYMAIRRPNKPAEEFAATDLFSLDNYLGTNPTEKLLSSGFPVDMSIIKNFEAADRRMLFSRLSGDGKYLRPPSNDAETSITGFRSDSNEGLLVNGTTQNLNGTSQRNIAHMWRRAPGYFDVVAYTGNGVTGRAVAHNLGAVPEMMWVKRRDGVGIWLVYTSSMGATDVIQLDVGGGSFSSGSYWNNTSPTSSSFTVGSAGTVNVNTGKFLAYLFATVAGISKVGSYTGTGNNLNVDCGFSAGARFILIKRTDSGGDWYVYDSVRGIVAGNDPYLLINEDAAQVTNTDYIDPLNAGFTVTSSAPAELNNNGGTYIFYAIA